jgi:outer membrane murein-binding lipoprotein Lpp
MTRNRALFVAFGVSVLVNLFVVVGVIAMATSASASNHIAGWLHAPTNARVQGLQFTTDDLETTVANLESTVGDSQSVGDLATRVDDLESAVGDSQSVDDLATRVDDLETARDSMCEQFSYSAISDLNDIYYQAC